MNKKNQPNEQEQLSQADIQKLLMQQLMQQKGAGAVANQKKANPFVRFASWAMQKSEKSVHYIDRFINFVIKKHDPDRNDVMQTARHPILFGAWVIFLFVFIGGLWSALAPLDSAATATGTVIASSHKQIIEYPSSGIIKRIFVKQGDYVIENQPLMELDETQLNASFQTYLTQYRSTLAQENRLVAERDNSPKIEFDEFLVKESYKPEVAKIINTQLELFKSKQEAFNGQIESYQKRIEQAKNQVEAYKARKLASDRTLAIIQDRYKAIKELNRQGFAQKAQMLEVEKRFVDAQSDVANTNIEIAKTEQEVNRLEIELFSKKSENLANIMQQLKETQVQLTDVKEKFFAAKDALGRAIIKSPVEGVINELHYHTIGGVVNPGRPIAEITPYKGHLVIEAKIPQKEIESLRVGLRAKLRFSAFKSRTTPVFNGTVISLSPDTVVDKQAQAAMHNAMVDETFYVARIEIDMDEFKKIAKERNLRLLPGMRAEIQIVRGTRTLLQYLLDPVTDNMFKAFKEK
ncbi:MAG: prsE [Rickettsiaceae bacterium]|jgi:HlyD family secretion protein|nr:prsE [Rickettsiaceae bacterium]